ncbi:hypothetical protein JCGZ_02374 [Jatropha curcas]|uniref:Uncharacterized protein n=1 Tax=Jatropha curcas TaxID=180498 RepID=A0A067KW02_JATCU|nr:hypothetical protein JCGZ_02374 [Jatropha curcas]
MGCFLGCFGFSSSKRKRRKPVNRIQPGDQGLCSYQSLDSASANLDKTQEPTNSDSELRNKAKEPLNCKIRKKVSFNLNVQSYEPIPKESENNWWESDEEEKKEESNEETAKEGQCLSLSEKMASYPSNYRYRNCSDSYDEEDEIACEESDLDDDEEDDDFDEDDDIHDLRISQEEFFRKLESLSVSSNKKDSLAEDKSKNLNPLQDSNEGGLKLVSMNQNARNRSQYVHPVLNPVENLGQWKAVKAKGTLPPVKRQRKENVALDKEIAVDASLSNWLVSVDSKKSASVRPFSWRSTEDMPILDITNLEP